MCRHLFVWHRRWLFLTLMYPQCSAGCSLPCVSLCSAYCSSTTFLCDMISMEEDLLHFPKLPDSFTWIGPDTPVHEASSSRVPMMRSVPFFVIQMLAYYFNHLCLLHKQRQWSNRGGCLAKDSCKHITQPLLQVIHVSILETLTIVLLEIYTIRQAEFPGLIVHVVASDRCNSSYTKDSHLDL